MKETLSWSTHHSLVLPFPSCEPVVGMTCSNRWEWVRTLTPIQTNKHTASYLQLGHRGLTACLVTADVMETMFR
jgi:hypothetical protein